MCQVSGIKFGNLHYVDKQRGWEDIQVGRKEDDFSEDIKVSEVIPKPFTVASLPKWGKKDPFKSDRTFLFTGGHSSRCQRRRIQNASSGPSEAPCSKGAVGERNLQEGSGYWTRGLQRSWLTGHRPGEWLWVPGLQSGSPGPWDSVCIQHGAQRAALVLLSEGRQQAGLAEGWRCSSPREMILNFKIEQEAITPLNSPSHHLELFQLKHQTQKTFNIKVLKWLGFTALVLFCFVFLSLVFVGLLLKA